MEKYADLEIGLRRREADVYGVDFRFSQPNSETDIRPSQGTANLDLKTINSHPAGSAAYGRALSDALFGDPAVNTALAQALASAQSLNLSLRLRLLIDAGAPELHALHWEALRRPGQDAPLCTDQNIVFSRYLSSQDWRAVSLRPKSDLRALVVVANPSNLNDYEGLAPLDVNGEIERTRRSLGEIPVSALPGEQSPAQRATLNNLLAALSEGGQDILYLHCHGALVKDEPYLWLEDEEGKAAVTPGKDLAARLRDLPQRPQLVVLGSCQSAGQSSAGQALAALGPRLAEAGIPAVIAMQGNISLDTLEAMMPVFFTQLVKDGQIDRALAAARAAVQDRPDYWMPALFMRLKRGRVWYLPGFGQEGGGFELWPSILRSIQRGQVTPILGPGLFESEIG
ncbi:MAG: CHAT domain-containing protein, partial [Chloroflexi bacterium]|nr:CHAT domain-containing protein [Chloroflexota bacterium]